MTDVAEVDVVTEPARARALLDATRIAILDALAEPASAAALARRLSSSRQALNYHLRELEKHGLIELVEMNRRGSCCERVYRRSGESYAISGAALGRVGARAAGAGDRFSSAYQIGLAARAIEDLAVLRQGASAAGKRLPTFALEVEVRFASAAARAEFAEGLARAVAELVARHHDERTPGGRTFRFYAGAYPKVKAKE